MRLRKKGADGSAPDPLLAAAVVGVALIQTGLAGLFVTTWWQRVRVLFETPEVVPVLWRVLTVVLFVWVVVAEARALVRRRRAPLTVLAFGSAATVVVLLLEAFGPR